MYGLEVKIRTGRLLQTRVGRTRRGGPRILEGQSETFEKLLQSGGFRDIAVVRSVNEMLDVLRGWGIPIRAALAQPR